MPNTHRFSFLSRHFLRAAATDPTVTPAAAAPAVAPAAAATPDAKYLNALFGEDTAATATAEPSAAAAPAAAAAEEVSLSASTPEQRTARLAEIAAALATETDDAKKADLAAEQAAITEFNTSSGAATSSPATTDKAAAAPGAEAGAAAAAASPEAITAAVNAAVTAALAQLAASNPAAAVAPAAVPDSEQQILADQNAARTAVRTVANILEDLTDKGETEYTHTNGTVFTKKQLRDMKADYEDALDQIPARLAAAQRHAAAFTTARQAHPKFFQPGAPEATAYAALLNELPWLKADPLAPQHAAEILAGRKALAVAKGGAQGGATKIILKPRVTMRVPKSQSNPAAANSGTGPTSDVEAQLQKFGLV